MSVVTPRGEFLIASSLRQMLGTIELPCRLGWTSNHNRIYGFCMPSAKTDTVCKERSTQYPAF